MQTQQAADFAFCAAPTLVGAALSGLLTVRTVRKAGGPDHRVRTLLWSTCVAWHFLGAIVATTLVRSIGLLTPESGVFMLLCFVTPFLLLIFVFLYHLEAWGLAPEPVASASGQRGVGGLYRSKPGLSLLLAVTLLGVLIGNRVQIAEPSGFDAPMRGGRDGR